MLNSNVIMVIQVFKVNRVFAFNASAARISLARTIVVGPLIMLYDEPTTGLDPVTSDEISSLINDVQKKYKTSSIIITHDIECARCTADRVIMLKDGEVYNEGKLDDFENSKDPLLKSFFK